MKEREKTAAGLPPCAACGEAPDASRVIAAACNEVYGAGWHDEWTVLTACAACLSITESHWGESAPAVRLRAPGTAVTRLRDSLRAAAEDGTLRREVGRLLSDGKRSWMAGVPELFREILPGIGKRLRLRTNLELRPPDERPAALGAGIPTTEVWGGPISRRRQATAVTGDGPGGVIPVPRTSSGAPRVGFPGPLLLVGLRVSVVGVRDGALLVELPEWAAGALGTSRILVPWGAAQRE